MVKQFIIICLFLILLVSSVHSTFAGKVEAAEDVGEVEETIVASNSKTVENWGGEWFVYEPGYDSVNDNNINNINFVGYGYDGGEIISESVLRFDLNGIPVNRIEQVSLELIMFHSRIGAFFDIWGSYDSSWNSGLEIPEKNVSIVEGYEEIPPSRDSIFSYDVTDFVLAQIEKDSLIMNFVFSGATEPLPGNEPTNERDSSFYSTREEISKQPRLKITYASNLPPMGTVTVADSENGYVNLTRVTLEIEATDPEGDQIEMSFRNDPSADWSEWQLYTQRREWSLSEGDGQKNVYMRLRDSAGNIYEASPATVILDTTPPTGNVYINDRAEYTNSRNVTLSITGTDAGSPNDLKMRLANDEEALEGAEWQPLASSVPWELTEGSGEKTVYLQLRDLVGNESEKYSVTITLIPPPAGSLTIANGARYTGSSEVNLSITANTEHNINEVKMRFSNDNQTWSEWLEYRESYLWTLNDESDGEKTVYMQLMDGLGSESELYEASMYLDTTPPTGTFLINGGAAGTNSTDVSLSLTADDGDGAGGIEMRFSNDGTSWTAWLPFQNFYSWTVLAGDGVKNVYVQFKDGVGNVSDSISQSIVLDTASPVITGVYDGQESNQDLTITFDKGSALLNGQPFESGSTIGADGSYTLVVSDDLGNTTTVHFIIDKTPPTGTITINDGTDYTNSANVTLTVTGSDGTGVGGIGIRLANHEVGLEEAAWQELGVGSISWELDREGDEVKTVYLQLRDRLENVSEPISATITYRSLPVPVNSLIQDSANVNIHIKAADFKYSNADNNNMHTIQLVSLPEHGELTFGSEKVFVDQEILMSELEQGDLVFTPEQDWFGTTELSWKAGNGYEYSAVIGKLSIELIPVNAPPDAPVDLQVSTGDGTVTLKWTGVTGAASYNVYQYEGGSTPVDPNEWMLVKAGIIGTTYMVTNLENGQSYIFTVTAVNAAGVESDFSPTVSVIPQPELEPDPEPEPEPPVLPDFDGPTWLEGSELTVSEITRSSVKLTWPAAIDNVGVTGYKIYVDGIKRDTVTNTVYRESVAAMRSATTVTSSVYDYSVTGLTANTKYTFRVVAFDAAGNESDALHTEATTKRRSSSSSSGGEASREEALSSNANLRQLDVRVHGITLPLFPGFKAGTTEYRVETDAEQVEIVAAVTHSAVIVTLEGKVLTASTLVDLEEGDNLFKLVVQAENGARQTYTLTIHRLILELEPTQEQELAHEQELTEPLVIFTDIGVHWAEQQIIQASMNKIIQGYPDGTFKPDYPITRAEFTVMLVNMLRLEEADGAWEFNDNDRIGTWASSAIVQAVQAGIVSGYADGSFRPDAPITRAEMAVMIARALRLHMEENTVTGFIDETEIPAWAKGAVEVVRKLGIVEGRGGNRFAPHANTTRAEAAVLLLRMTDRSNQHLD